MQDDAAKRWDDSLISLGLGALVVVVSGILIYNYFSGQTPNILQSTQESSVTATPVAMINETSPQPTPSASPSVQMKNSSPTPTAQASESTANQGVLALPTTYTVASGDSLWKLAEKFYGSGYEWRRIAEANKMTSSSKLTIGAQIAIPRVELISAASTIKTPTPATTQVAAATTKPTVAPTAKPTATSAPSATAQPTSTPTPTASVKPTATPSSAVAQGKTPATAVEKSTPASGEKITYTVKRGDSLWKIAGSTCGNSYLWTSIARQNNLANPSVIHAGNVFTYTCSK